MEPVSDPVVENNCPVVVLLLVVLLLLLCSALSESLPDFSVWGFVLWFVRQLMEFFSVLVALEERVQRAVWLSLPSPIGHLSQVGIRTSVV